MDARQPLVPADDPRAAWRREVGSFRSREQRRRHPLGVHVGEPDRWRESLELTWPEPRWHDSGLRADLLTTLVACLEPGSVTAAWGWLARPGVAELHDADLAWYAAATHAFGVHGIALTGFVAVTRTGWLDVATGERRSWKRLRLGPGARGQRRTRDGASGSG